EIDVALPVFGDRGDVVDAVELHAPDHSELPSRTTGKRELVRKQPPRGLYPRLWGRKSKGRVHDRRAHCERLLRDRSHADRRAHGTRDGGATRAHTEFG